MLPAEEYQMLKRKQAAVKARAQKNIGYDKVAFANAIHGMPPPMKAAPKHMPQNLGSQHQDYWKRRQANMKPVKKPEYSSPQIRKDFAYRPQGLTGKAGEVLGVTNKAAHVKPRKVLGYTQPKSQFEWDSKKSKKAKFSAKKVKSSGCVVM